MPARIWYVDPIAQVYHERWTNTFIMLDGARRGWIAVSRETALKDFRPERARLLLHGPPDEVSRVLDYLLEMEPAWHGS
jgi:hypothetical protein